MTDRLLRFKFGRNSARGWTNFERDLNKLVDRVNDLQELADELLEQRGIAERRPRDRRTERTVNDSDTETIRVANMTGAPLGFYNVVRVELPPQGRRSSNELLNDYHNGQSIFHAKTPENGDSIFAVTLEAASPKAVVSAKISGIVGVMVDVKDVSHGFAAIEGGRTSRLVSSDSGYARLLSPPQRTGVQFCTIFLGTPSSLSIHVGTVRSGYPINYGVDPNNAGHGGQVVEEGKSEYLRAFAGMLRSGESISAGKRVEWIHIGGVNRIINAECE